MLQHSCKRNKTPGAIATVIAVTCRFLDPYTIHYMIIHREVLALSPGELGCIFAL